MLSSAYVLEKSVELNLQIKFPQWLIRATSEAVSGLFRLAIPFLISGYISLIWIFASLFTNKLSRSFFNVSEAAQRLNKKLLPKTITSLVTCLPVYQEALLVLENYREERNLFEKLIVWGGQINYLSRILVNLEEIILALKSFQSEDQEEIVRLEEEISSLVKDIDFKSIARPNSI